MNQFKGNMLLKFIPLYKGERDENQVPIPPKLPWLLPAVPESIAPAEETKKQERSTLEPFDPIQIKNDEIKKSNSCIQKLSNNDLIALQVQE